MRWPPGLLPACSLQKNRFRSKGDAEMGLNSGQPSAQMPDFLFEQAESIFLAMHRY
jgi:hypothetical protein